MEKDASTRFAGGGGQINESFSKVYPDKYVLVEKLSGKLAFFRPILILSGNFCSGDLHLVFGAWNSSFLLVLSCHI